jgi:hypothetical protein
MKRDHDGVLTGTAGEYRFAGLPTGNYSLRLEKTEAQSQTREGVELTSAGFFNSRFHYAEKRQSVTGLVVAQ